MQLNNLFQKTSSHWVRYAEYEYREKDGILYLCTTLKSKPVIYNPMADSNTLALDALNVGLICMGQKNNDTVIKETILDFVTKYGLLGFMTALPTTPHFMDYESVYLHKNPIITAEVMPIKEFTDIFFPFGELDVKQNARSTVWNVMERDMIALSLTMRDMPAAMSMSFQRGYCERYDWLKKQFKDMAYTFCAAYYYGEETDETMRELHRKAISSFGGNTPTYHIVLTDKPNIVWDFHSLLLAVQMIMSFMITDDTRPLRMCKHCQKAFIATHPKAEFCGHLCKNKHNVYKSRGKKE